MSTLTCSVTRPFFEVISLLAPKGTTTVRERGFEARVLPVMLLATQGDGIGPLPEGENGPERSVALPFSDGHARLAPDYIRCVVGRVRLIATRRADKQQTHKTGGGLLPSQA